WQERDEAAGQRTAGIRSFGVCGLLGGVAAAIGTVAGPGGWAGLLLVGLCFLGLSAAMIVFKDREGRAEGSFSVTSVLVAQAAFLLGALAVLGDLRVAAAAAVALTAVLASRDALHGLIAKLSWQELRAAILLLSMTLVILPLIPDQRLSVLAGLNPHRIWSFAVVLAAVSFAGYVAVRLFGASLGLLVAGAAAGLTSSTAAVLMNARAARTGRVSVLAAEHGRSAAAAAGRQSVRAAARPEAGDPAVDGGAVVRGDVPLVRRQGAVRRRPDFRAGGRGCRNLVGNSAGAGSDHPRDGRRRGSTGCPVEHGRQSRLRRVVR